MTSTTDDEQHATVKLNGKLQITRDDTTSTMSSGTAYAGEQVEIDVRERYWNRGTSLQPVSVGFYRDLAIVFRAADATYLAMPLTRG